MNIPRRLSKETYVWSVVIFLKQRGHWIIISKLFTTPVKIKNVERNLAMNNKEMIIWPITTLNSKYVNIAIRTLNMKVNWTGIWNRCMEIFLDLTWSIKQYEMFLLCLSICVWNSLCLCESCHVMDSCMSLRAIQFRGKTLLYFSPV